MTSRRIATYLLTTAALVHVATARAEEAVDTPTYNLTLETAPAGTANAPTATVTPQGIAIPTPGRVRIGRYSTLPPAPRADQRDPLNCIVEVRFPQTIGSVGSAVDHLLTGSGFRLATGPVAHPALPTLLALPLPTVHRALGPVSLRDGLRTLAGEAWQLEVDPLHRLVSFKVSQTFDAVNVHAAGWTQP